MQMLAQAKRLLRRHLGRSRNRNRMSSYSQSGEDCIIKYLFALRGIDCPSYVDIGAHDPYFLSNTAHFYLSGSRGVNIEANPALFENFLCHRPEDLNLNVGIAADCGRLKFYIMRDSTLSTFDESEVKELERQGQELSHVVEIPVTTFENAMEQCHRSTCPDLMSIDTEGTELRILESINFDRYRPKVLCVEAATYSSFGAGEKRMERIGFLRNRGYIEYANTNLNAIMVDRAFWETV